MNLFIHVKKIMNGNPVVSSFKKYFSKTIKTIIGFKLGVQAVPPI